MSYVKNAIEMSNTDLRMVEDCEHYLDSLLKDAERYLVFAKNCTWNGGSGYNIVGEKEDALYRSYDSSIYPQKGSRGGKVLVCREYHHDVPTGHPTIVIALTDREYESVCRSSFEEVEAFVESRA